MTTRSAPARDGILPIAVAVLLLLGFGLLARGETTLAPIMLGIGYVVVVNKKFWDGLAPDIRGELSKAMKEATELGNGQSAKENDDALAEIRKAGKTEILTLTPEQDAAMRKAIQPVYKDVASRVGQSLIDEFIKETGATGH